MGVIVIDLFLKRKEKFLALQALRGRKTPKPQPQAEADAVKKDKSGENASVFVRCPSCGKDFTRTSFAENLCVCPACGYHHPISAYYRLSLILDHGTFSELDRRMASSDPLAFPGYADKLAAQRKKTGLAEAVVTCEGEIEGEKAVVAVLDSRFLMGSMGAAVGEKITRAIEYAQKMRLPLIIFSASGGARMQEGIYSLMQMAKTSAALQQFDRKGGLFISYFTHPTTGGVTASFASLGDITLAEPGALIGFAGPRVIEQTIGQKLPEGFQRSEYLLEHGFIDQIVERKDMRATLALLLRMHDKKGKTGC